MAKINVVYQAPDLTDWQPVCEAGDLQDSAVGVRFEVHRRTGESGLTQTLPAVLPALPAFAIKFQGQVLAYLNQCAHVAMEMDWQAGHFFDVDGQYIVCASHGALYEPSAGRCIAGPCVGQNLIPITLQLYNNTYYAPKRI